MWLLKCLKPDHNTIANFRSDNPETIVAIPSVPSASQAPDPLFNYEFFKYNQEDDTYTCSGGKVLRTNGSWYKQRSDGGGISWFKQYKIKACRKCPVRSQCTRSEKERLIQRSEYAGYYEANRVNVKDKERLYKGVRQLLNIHLELLNDNGGSVIF